ncbi:MAG: HlyD family efflux transporter periplasmic adaptor subunit [Bacteroidetes bacterium]|nr:HlyD family efflux transporter periplasmic adaptor subunit [Bacteroidota bacterium]MBS1973565.1 HlyD family efflux transporter periplasmic adaptor subunit [Bacteroidota bacterium]
MLTALLLLASCQPKATEDAAGQKNADAVSEGTPVAIAHAQSGAMSETVEVNAVSSFLLKTYVKANVNGYLESVNAQLGKYVAKGQELFVIKTKEAQTLGNTVNSLDTSLHFAGVIHIKAPGNGYITQLTYQAGNYVQDNEQLAVITDTKSFVFLLDLPYELKPYLPNNKNLQLKLPDGTILNGHIEEALPTVDAASQTQSYVIRVNTDKQIPENLIAKVGLVKKAKQNAISVPKSALLTDEAQSEFWIMKLIDSSTAVKVPVQKGIETNSAVEILFPKLTDSDLVLVSGNYGLTDTAKVSVQK